MPRRSSRSRSRSRRNRNRTLKGGSDETVYVVTMVDSHTTEESNGITLNTPYILGVFNEYESAKKFAGNFVPGDYLKDFNEEFEDKGRQMIFDRDGYGMFISIKTRTMNNEQQFMN